MQPNLERNDLMKKHLAHLSVAVAMLACLGMVGCASFPGNQLPHRSRADIVTPDHKPAIDFQMEWHTFGRLHPGWSQVWRRTMRQRLVESGMFSDVEVGTGVKEYHLAIKIHNDGNRVVAALTGFMSGLTLTILPGYARDDYTLIAELSRDGNVLKTYEYKDHVTTWTQLFMIFAFNNFNKAGKVAGQVCDNMVWNLLYDIQEDNVLKPRAP